MLLLLLYVCLALGVSFLCSLLEATLLSITPSYVALLEQERNPVAGRLRTLRADVDKPLAAILSLNTVAHTVGAAGAGAQAAKVFGDAAVGIFSGVLTLLVLALSEIVPKSLGAAHWKWLAPRIVPVLRVFMIVAWPLVKLSGWLTRLVTPKSTRPAVDRDEIAALASEGQKEGVIAEGESRVLSNLMRLSRLSAKDVMTPLDHLFALPADADVREVVENHEDLQYSRIPVHVEEQGRRRFTAYALKDDILAQANEEDPGRTLEALSREAVFVEQHTPLPSVFDLMAERREHIVFAADEAGEMVGIVTMEDIIETLLGVEIFDEADEERVHELARESWARRAPPQTLLGITGAASDGGTMEPRSSAEGTRYRLRSPKRTEGGQHAPAARRRNKPLIGDVRRSTEMSSRPGFTHATLAHETEQNLSWSLRGFRDQYGGERDRDDDAVDLIDEL